VVIGWAQRGQARGVEGLAADLQQHQLVRPLVVEDLDRVQRVADVLGIPERPCLTQASI